MSVVEVRMEWTGAGDPNRSDFSPYWWKVTLADDGSELRIPIRWCQEMHRSRLTGDVVDVTYYPEPVELCREEDCSCPCGGAGTFDHIRELAISVMVVGSSAV